MANMIREKFEQEFGKRFEQIEKTLERTFEKTVEKTLKSPAGAKAQAKAMAAKQTLDQVLLGLEHKGYNLKEPQDLIQTVGRKVLERANEIANEVAKAAEDVRSQVAAKPYSPTWVKDLKIPQMNFGSASAPATTAEMADAGLHSDPEINSTSMSEASKSDKAADFAPAGDMAKKANDKSSKKSMKNSDKKSSASLN